MTTQAGEPGARVEVAGERPYSVIIGRGLLTAVPELIPGARQVAVVFSDPLRPRAEAIEGILRDAGLGVLPIEVPDAEDGKTIEVAARCWDLLGAARFTRTDAVVGVGGGAVTDVAGFVAASWLRGVRVVNVPTSLLGMVDAAVGGKTGINTTAGKNLVGAFHPPSGTVCDLDCLQSLPKEELRSGLAEVVKAGFIADPTILDMIEASPDQASDPSTAVLAELVRRAIEVKARVVGADLRETGLREILNYGHTLAHAIERLEDYTWRHGDAVAVGLVFASELGGVTGRLTQDEVWRHRSVLNMLGLPVSYRADAWAELEDIMRIDKKARGSSLRFVLLEGIGKPVVVADLDPELLRAAYQEVSG